MTAVPALFRRIARWGQPWHGLMHNNVLTLPNAMTLPCLELAGARPGDTRYFRAPGRPVPPTRDDEAAIGMLWTNDVILWGSQQSYSPLVASPLETTWIYWSPGGRRWSIIVEAVPQGAVPRVVSPGAPVFLDVRVTAIEMDLPPSQRNWITLLNWQAFGANVPGLSGGPYLEPDIQCIVEPLDMRRDLCPRPDGAAALLTWRIGVENTYAAPILKPGEIGLIGLRIDITGETPAATITLDGSRDTASYYVTGPDHNVNAPHYIFRTRLAVGYNAAGDRVEMQDVTDYRGHDGTFPQVSQYAREIHRNGTAVASVPMTITRATSDDPAYFETGKYAPGVQAAEQTTHNTLMIDRATNNAWAIRAVRWSPSSASYIDSAGSLYGQTTTNADLASAASPYWASANPRTGDVALNLDGPVCWV